MPSEILRRELAVLAKRAIWLNIAAYLISTAVMGITVSFGLGLLLGTAVLFGTLMLLRLSILRMAEDAKRTGTTSQRRYLLYYAMRLLLFAVAFGASLLLRRWISPVAVVIPMIYPRLIYTADAVLHRSDSASGGKKR